jgi:hypothetical protein
VSLRPALIATPRRLAHAEARRRRHLVNRVISAGQSTLTPVPSQATRNVSVIATTPKFTTFQGPIPGGDLESDSRGRARHSAPAGALRQRHKGTNAIDDAPQVNIDLVAHATVEKSRHERPSFPPTHVSSCITRAARAAASPHPQAS